MFGVLVYKHIFKWFTTTLIDPTRSFRIRHVRRIKCRTEKIAFIGIGFSFHSTNVFLHCDGRDVESPCRPIKTIGVQSNYKIITLFTSYLNIGFKWQSYKRNNAKRVGSRAHLRRSPIINRHVYTRNGQYKSRARVEHDRVILKRPTLRMDITDSVKRLKSNVNFIEHTRARVYLTGWILSRIFTISTHSVRPKSCRTKCP